ncbi:unnamed protein product, partial [Iphiclides podalirius]
MHPKQSIMGNAWNNNHPPPDEDAPHDGNDAEGNGDPLQAGAIPEANGEGFQPGEFMENSLNERIAPPDDLMNPSSNGDAPQDRNDAEGNEDPAHAGAIPEANGEERVVYIYWPDMLDTGDYFYVEQPPGTTRSSPVTIPPPKNIPLAVNNPQLLLLNKSLEDLAVTKEMLHLLSLMLHSRLCLSRQWGPVPEECPLSNCEYMRSILTHLENCDDWSCRTPDCKYTYVILDHWDNCPTKAECALCGTYIRGITPNYLQSIMDYDSDESDATSYFRESRLRWASVGDNGDAPQVGDPPQVEDGLEALGADIQPPRVVYILWPGIADGDDYFLVEHPPGLTKSFRVKIPPPKNIPLAVNNPRLLLFNKSLEDLAVTKDMLHLLSLMLHARICLNRQWVPVRDDCPLPNCEHMRSILTHIENCNNWSCREPDCKYTFVILNHWDHCPRKVECPLCGTFIRGVAPELL